MEPQIPVQVSLSIGDDAGVTSMKADLDRRREPLTMKVIIGDDRGQSSTPTMWGGRLLRPAAHTANQWTSRKLRRECRECPDMARRGPNGSGRACLLCPGSSDVNLFRNGEGIIDLDTEVPDSAFDLGVTEQELHGAQIAGTSVDQGCLGPS